MEQEIINGNELIAKFLNFTQKSYTPESEKMWCDEKQGLPVGELKFHSDWNWLIPVMKKISQKDDIYKAGVANIMSEYEYDIIRIWETVVKHIKLSGDVA
jgi:hypothetical protein